MALVGVGSAVAIGKWELKMDNLRGGCEAFGNDAKSAD